VKTRIDTVLDRLVMRRAAARLARLGARAGSADLAALKALRPPLRQMRREIDRVLHEAEGRLALPVAGADAMRKPLHCDWAWRPEIWRGPVSPPGLAAAETRAGFGSQATVFHDCAQSELTLRQIRNRRDSDLAPFGLRIDVFRFDGSFLSLVIHLPEAAVQGLGLRHVIRMDSVVETEKPLEIFARLNIRHGPNTEQIVRELPLGAAEVAVEFDLAYTRMNEKRVERAWVDLIFEGPEMNQIVLRDVTFTRRPRAEL